MKQEMQNTSLVLPKQLTASDDVILDGNYQRQLMRGFN